jgi:hypothetical protein
MKIHFIAAAQRAPEDDPGLESLRAWLAGLPSDIEAVAQALAARLFAMNRSVVPGRLRLQMLELCRTHAAPLLPHLKAPLENVRPPLAQAFRHRAYLIEKLEKELAAGYVRVTMAKSRAWPARLAKKELHLALVRAMDFNARRLSLSHALYARAPRGVWAELHALYRMACAAKIEKLKAPPSRAPMEIYRHALLLAFAQPTQLMPGEFPRVAKYVDEWASLAHLAKSPIAPTESSGVFVVTTRADRAGAAWSQSGPDQQLASELLLITRDLVARVESHARLLREGAAPMQLQLPEETIRPEDHDLLKRLAALWRGERQSRSARLQFHPRVGLWVGLREIWRSLRVEIAQAASAPRSEPSPRPSQWIVVNESAHGFALSFMSGALPAIAVGEVVAIKPKEDGAPLVCLVRWITSNNRDHFELGLQQLGPFAVPALYSTASQKGGEPVLFFPRLPASRRSAVVLMPTNRHKSDEPFSLRHRRGLLSLRARRVLQRTTSVDLIEVGTSLSRRE